MMDAATLLKLRSYLTVAHHIPGRIRVKVKLDILNDPQALALARSVDVDSWSDGNASSAIINTRLNTNAGSMVVEYDPQKVAPDLIDDLFSSPDADRVKQLLEQLADLLGLNLNIN